jgi:glycosyltransferase involved in cell wall biosynthesis
MKILFLIQSMGQGGAQRSLLTLLPELNSLLNHEVYLAFWNEEMPAYEIPSCINVIQLGKYSINKSKFRNYLHSINIVKKTIKSISPEYVVATMCDMYAKVFFGNLVLRKKVIAWEHTSMGRKMQFESEISRRFLYQFANKIVLLTNKDKKLVESKYKNTFVIPNGVPFNSVLDQSCIRENTIMTIGRLDVWHIKGFDLLLRIWGSLSKKHPEWRLQIAGGGNENSINKVNTFITENKVLDSVELLGYRHDMDTLLKKSKIFVLSSRVEGFPMSLIEAMSQGNGCVCFSVNGAIQDIITNEKDGFIVEDGNLDKFAEYLETLIVEESLLKKISANAVDSVQRFKPSNVAKMWNDIFNI